MLGSGLCQAAGDSRVTDAGTVISWALPVATAVTQASLGDREGLREFAISWTTTVGLTEILKKTTGKERPDGSDRLSFPSGHAARAFAAASHVNRRYGSDVAWPLYVGAVAVGWSRVQARRHDWVDVTGAALVSEWMARTWTTPREGGWRVSADKVNDSWTLRVLVPL